MRNRKSEKGFTIIELVVVILLLGILTATALPRFMDITSEAHDAVVDGVLGGLNTAVALSRATWFAQGRSGAITGMGNQTVNVNTLGYPTNQANGAPTSNTDCVTVYQQMLQAGGRPTISTMAIAGVAPAASDLEFNSDFQAAHSASTCYFIYTAEGQNVSSPVLLYETTAGTVLLGTEL